jgi:hypothetical protein
MNILNSFSVWVFAVFVLWALKIFKFSPLLLLLIHLTLSTFFVVKEYDYTVSLVAIAIIAIHAKPLYFIRHHPFAFKETLVILALYNAYLLTQGTTMLKEYKNVYEQKPKNFKDFLIQA